MNYEFGLAEETISEPEDGAVESTQLKKTKENGSKDHKQKAVR